MRIGYFSDTYPPEINGVSVAQKTLYDIFTKNGHEVYVITTNPFSNKVEFKDNILRIPGKKLKWLYDYRLTFIYNRKATKIIKKMNLDIIHIQTEAGVGIYGRIMAKYLDIPSVYTYHTMYIDYVYYVTKGKFDHIAKNVVRKFSKTCAETCTEFTTPSIKTKDALRSYGVSRYINVIPNGIDISRFDEKLIAKGRKEQFIKDHKLENTFLFLSLGRVAKEKSIDFLIRCYAMFLKKYPDAPKSKFLIVGDGPAKLELETLCDSLNLQEDVLFLGKVPYDDVPFYYSLADVYLSASTSETQGLTFIEAMASKTLVCCRFDDNLVDVVHDSENGYFFTDEAACVEVLKKATLMSTELKQKLINNAFENVQKYSIDTFYERMLEVYNRAIRKTW